MNKSIFIPESAPFSLEQRSWLNGFLTGILAPGSTGAEPTTLTPKVEEVKLPIAIFYGSQSGNSESIAFKLLEKLNGSQSASRCQGFVYSMEQFENVEWASFKYTIWITSTWGNGDFPDNAVSMWEWLKGDRSELKNLNFSVLGLGDRNYAKFCHAGKLIAERLDQLGAKAFIPGLFCDTDFQEMSEKWIEQLDKLLGIEAEKILGPRSEANIHSHSQSNVHDKKSTENDNSLSFGKSNPFSSCLLENRHLCGRESKKDVRHLSFSLPSEGLSYQPGDALGVYVRNSYDLADHIILALNANGRERVMIKGKGLLPLREALLHHLDLNLVTPALVKLLGEKCKRPTIRDFLLSMVEENNVDELKAWCSGKDVLEALRSHSYISLDPNDFCANLRALGPRLYSISSSPLAHPGEVHLTVGVVRYEADGRKRLGVASTLFAERLPLGMHAPIYVQASKHFHLPEDKDAPIICVGPGTGIAPFKGFLEHRSVTGVTGKSWLLFGNPKRHCDFLYEEELTQFRKSGVLDRLSLAFSQDGTDKVYVQDKMREEGQELWRWLDNGAYFYVCGDAKRMAADVEKALIDVAQHHGGKSEEQAREWLNALRTQGRYRRDVY